nr:hypothetical protein [Tanacetum cinerariifolium]
QDCSNSGDHKVKKRVKKLERRNKLKVSKLRRLKKVGNEDVILKDAVVVAKEVKVEKTTEIEENADVQGRQADATIIAATTLIPAATITVAPSATRKTKGVTREQMEEEDSKALKRASKSQAEKAAKKQKLDEEVEELKKHLQIVPNDEDDVYTEATPLARKVPIDYYEIYSENNKPYYKIMRADGSH